jgi:hypothetical protein
MAASGHFRGEGAMNRIWSVLALAASLLAAPSAMGQGTQPAIASGQSLPGELTPNDSQRRSGKYEDIYTLQGRRGARIDLQLASDDFDSYLVVTGPDGFSLSNDDAQGDSLNSRLVMEFPADGTYRVAVTTFRPGETGTYRLQVGAPPAGVAITAPERAQPIAIGVSIAGQLSEGDGRLGSGEYADRYRFSARRGQRIRAELVSGKVDTYLSLRRPDGSQDDNDDTETEGRTSTNSRIDTVLAEDGEYVLVATSFPRRDRRLSADARAQPGAAAPGRRSGRAAGGRPARRSLRLWGPRQCPA